MSKEGKKDTLPLCLPDPSVHQRSWKTSIHQHPAVPPSHHDCPVGELPQVSIRSSLKERARCFWQLWETKSEQLEVSGGCFGIAQSSGFLNFPYPKEVHNRPHPNYWGAISYQCPDVSQEVLPVVFRAAFAVGTRRQKAGGLALAPRSMVCTLLGPELFPWEAGLQDHRPQPRQVPFHPQSCILSHAEICYSVVKVEFRLWAWFGTITIIQITKRIKTKPDPLVHSFKNLSPNSFLLCANTKGAFHCSNILSRAFVHK